MRELSLREIQLSEFEILIEFDKICRENNLRYSLAAGTLLGAVRHKGFIPWDDDIDVMMPRPDYEKFRNIFHEKADTFKFDLTADRGEQAKYPFIKMINKSVEVHNIGFAEVNCVWIDIFPLDGFPADRKKSLKLIKKAQLYKHVILVSKYRNSKYYHGRHSKLKFLMGRAFAKLYGVRRALKNSLKLAFKRSYNNSQYIGIIVWNCYGIGERLLKSQYENLTELMFEGNKFYCIECWDNYLHELYGDYMQIPSEDKRKTHNIKALQEDNVDKH